MTSTYVYGAPDDSLIFIREQLATQLATLYLGFSTWRDAEAGLDPSIWADIRTNFVDAEVDLPKPDDAFELDDIPGHSDGDWPAWPAALMLDELPKTVIEKFGSKEDSVFNGRYLSLPASDEAAIVDALSEHGWVCRRNEELVRTACGY